MAILAGQVLTSEALNEGPNSYTPMLSASISNPTLGTGATQSGWWARNLRTVVGGALIRFGTSGVSPGSGIYRISLPVLPDLTLLTSSGSQLVGSHIGSAFVLDSDTVANRTVGGVWLASASGTGLCSIQAADGDSVSDANPFVFASQDAINISFVYPVPEP